MLNAIGCPTLAGVLLNTVLADWLITFLLTALLLLMTYRTLRKSLSLHQARCGCPAVLVHSEQLVVRRCMVWVAGPAFVCYGVFAIHCAKSLGSARAVGCPVSRPACGYSA